MSFMDDLKTELSTDPLTRGYSGMDDVEAAADLNTTYRTRNRITMTGSEVINAIDKTEFNSKTDAEKRQVWDILHLGDVNPFGIEADLFVDVFGSNSTTIANLQNARKQAVSRAEELSLPSVKAGQVQMARS